MSASVHRYPPDDPAGMTNDDRNAYGEREWPDCFMEKASELGFDVDLDPALRMRLWALWKDARSWE